MYNKPSYTIFKCLYTIDDEIARVNSIRWPNGLLKISEYRRNYNT